MDALNQFDNIRRAIHQEKPMSKCKDVVIALDKALKPHLSKVK